MEIAGKTGSKDPGLMKSSLPLGLSKCIFKKDPLLTANGILQLPIKLGFGIELNCRTISRTLVQI